MKRLTLAILLGVFASSASAIIIPVSVTGDSNSIHAELNAQFGPLQTTGFVSERFTGQFCGGSYAFDYFIAKNSTFEGIYRFQLVATWDDGFISPEIYGSSLFSGAGGSRFIFYVPPDPNHVFTNHGLSYLIAPLLVGTFTTSLSDPVDGSANVTFDIERTGLSQQRGFLALESVAVPDSGSTLLLFGFALPAMTLFTKPNKSGVTA